jgi:hypothetical protein
VAEDWVEARRRSSEGVRATMTAGDRDHLSPGAAEVRDHFADDLHSLLWDRPDVRKRWVLRARNEGSVREVADALVWDVAVSLDRILPTDLLGPTVIGAVLNNFAEAIELNRQSRTNSKKEDRDGWLHLYVLHREAKMLDWFIRHHPQSAHACIGDLMHAAHARWQIPAQETLRILAQAVALDGKLSREAREAFFALLTPPEKTA